MITLETINNLKKSLLIIKSYNKYINPLNEVKHAQKPLNKIVLLEFLKFFVMKTPNKNDPSKEISKLLLIYNLKKVAK